MKPYSEEAKAARRAEYKRYLNGREWAVIRAGAIARAGGRCDWCKGAAHLHVHHRKYPRVFGTETPDMLQVLCDPCHAERHGQPYLVTKMTHTERFARKERLKVYRGPEKKAMRKLRLLARQERRAARAAGRKPKPTPSKAQLLAVIDTPSLKDRF